MRKSLWIIPVVLLLTALGSTTARADTIACGTATCVTTGGFVTEIEGLNIDGTAYNVTFDTTDSSPAPFDTNGEAGDASGAIIAALGGDEIVNASLYGGALQLIAVDAGGGSAYIDYLRPGGGGRKTTASILLRITLLRTCQTEDFISPIFQPPQRRQSRALFCSR